MKSNLKAVLIIATVFIVGLIIWNISLLNTNTALQKELYELEENYHSLDSFNEVLKYDLGIARDSVRIFENKLKNNS